MMDFKQSSTCAETLGIPELLSEGTDGGKGVEQEKGRGRSKHKLYFLIV